VNSADTITVSYSELAAGRKCPLRWWLEYGRRLRPAATPPPPGDPRARGTVWHTVLEAWYRSLLATQGTGATPADRLAHAQDAVATQWAGPLADVHPDTRALVEWMHAGHVDAYGIDPGWWILAVEERVETPLPTVPGAPAFALKGRADLIVWDVARQAIVVVDHKSAGELPRSLDMSTATDQLSAYAWAFNQDWSLHGAPEWLTVDAPAKVRVTSYSVARTRQTKTPVPLDRRFVRIDSTRPAAYLSNVAVDLAVTAAQLYGAQATPSAPDLLGCRFCDFSAVHDRARAIAPATVDGVRDTMVDLLTAAGWAPDFTRH